jgi:hypothetical protein
VTAEGSEFESRSRQDFLHVIWTDSGVLLAAYEMGTAGIKRSVHSLLYTYAYIVKQREDLAFHL